MGKVLHSLDRNGDGKVDIEEVHQALDDSSNQDISIDFWRRIAALLLAMVFLISGAVFGMVWLVVAINQDTRVQDAVLLDTRTSQPVQVSFFVCKCFWLV